MCAILLVSHHSRQSQYNVVYMYQHDTSMTLEPDYNSLTCTKFFFYSTIVLVVKGESIYRER